MHARYFILVASVQQISPMHACCTLPTVMLSSCIGCLPTMAALSPSEVCRKRCVGLPSSQCDQCQLGYWLWTISAWSYECCCLLSSTTTQSFSGIRLAAQIARVMIGPCLRQHGQWAGAKMADLPGRTQMTVTRGVPSQSGHAVLCECVPAPHTHAALAPG